MIHTKCMTSWNFHSCVTSSEADNRLSWLHHTNPVHTDEVRLWKFHLTQTPDLALLLIRLYVGQPNLWTGVLENLIVPHLDGPGYLSRYSNWLRDGWSGDRIPVGATFSAPVQNGPGAHPASYTMGTGSFPGVKRPGRGVNHPRPSIAEVKERVELYLYSTSGPS